MVICKPRHWKLGIRTGIGIGIGTDTTKAIISTSTSTRSMDTKRSRVVTYDEDTPPKKSCYASISWSLDKIRQEYIYL